MPDEIAGLKLFIWQGDGILQDFASGMIVALAPDLRTARNVVRRSYTDTGSGDLEPSLARRPQVIRLAETTSPQAWYVNGGS
jgi:hypothetical protein